MSSISDPGLVGGLLLKPDSVFNPLSDSCYCVITLLAMPGKETCFNSIFPYIFDKSRQCGVIGKTTKLNLVPQTLLVLLYLGLQLWIEHFLSQKLLLPP